MVSQTILWLDVHLASPIIVLPFEQEEKEDKECWILNLGDLTVKTNPAILAESIAENDKNKDMFDIKLSDIKMQYFPSLTYYNEYEWDRNAEFKVRDD